MKRNSVESSSATVQSTSGKSAKLQFGYYKIPVSIAIDGLTLSIEKEKDRIVYNRTQFDKSIDKVILTETEKVLICPVEPVNIPKKITHNFQIALEKPVIIGPKKTKSILLTFPVELGVFVYENKIYKLLDVFSLVKNKYTLYGDPKTGTLCRYWQSPIHSTIPPVDPIREGVLQLTIRNTGHDWTVVTNSVFNAFGMKIYYNNQLVAMLAEMEIKNGKLAETDFFNKPLRKDMYKAIELYSGKMVHIGSVKFVMEEGI